MKYAAVLLICFLLNADLIAQQYTTLNRLIDRKFDVYYSAGADKKATRIARQLEMVMEFYQQQLQFRPEITVLILSAGDWKTYTSFPFYGMPHYTGKKELIIAAEDNEFWRNSIPELTQLSASQRSLFEKTYTNDSGVLSLEPLFDLLAIHELGHAYHNQGGLVMQRRWLAEFFPNLLLHGFIAEKQPWLLPALTCFPASFVAVTKKEELTYTTLQQLEIHYNEIGQKFPQNYAWYQCRWHMAAADVYSKSGNNALVILWQALKLQQQKIDDPQLVELLKEKADIAVEWL